MNLSKCRFEDIVEEYHKRVYGEKRLWTTTLWRGVHCQKMPQDLWVLGEIIMETLPEIIIETGTADGGSSLFMADICHMLRIGEVHTIDVRLSDVRVRHPRLNYWTGSSTDDAIFHEISARAEGKSVLVNLDSDHKKDHVLREMVLYGSLVSSGSYMIVEDTNVNKHPVRPDHGPGPFEAVEEFLASYSSIFEVDRHRERYMTFFPGGWLKRL